MNTTLRLTIYNAGTPAEYTMYRNMVGSLLYLTMNRPNNSFSAGVYAQLQVNPKGSYLNIVKCIINYIISTCRDGILYSSYSNTNIVGSADTEWVGM